MKYLLSNEKLEESVSEMREQLARKDKQIQDLVAQSEERSQQKQADEDKAQTAISSMKSFYSLDRFDTSFTSDVAMYLKKNSNEDSFVRSMRSPTRGLKSPRKKVIGTPRNKYK